MSAWTTGPALVVATTLLVASAAQASDGGRASLERLSGIYASPKPESWYDVFATREYSFQDGRWTLRFRLALDPEMRQPILLFRTGGPYDVGRRSSSQPDAFEVVFHETAKFVTLLTTDPAMIQAFGLADCGLRADAEVDISVTGCAYWKPVADCGMSHDLLATDDAGALYLGVRPRDNDLCTADKRPAALLEPVVKQ